MTALPTVQNVKFWLAASAVLRKKVFAIARRLEALNEYNPEQALIVAADIVRQRWLKDFKQIKE
jgi:hypothetical protein